MSKPCNTCGQLFTSTYALEEHVLKAPNHPKCATCKKSFRDEKGLEQHIQKEHQPLLCGVCMARFPSRQALADHIARAHPSSTRRTGSTPPGYPSSSSFPGYAPSSYGPSASSTTPVGSFPPPVGTPIGPARPAGQQSLQRDHECFGQTRFPGRSEDQGLSLLQAQHLKLNARKHSSRSRIMRGKLPSFKISRFPPPQVRFSIFAFAPPSLYLVHSPHFLLSTPLCSPSPLYGFVLTKRT
ncbi:hypothetical protein K523DRAFT_373225 [Schizophyllum commune Tattone D]|nr:hypothetical protein K523DRAFT_373225 [Schizophyllum commune Tattone D]